MLPIKILVFIASTLVAKNLHAKPTPRLNVAIMQSSGTADLDSQCILKGFWKVNPTAKNNWDVKIWEYEVDAVNTKKTTERIAGTKPDLIVGPEYSHAAAIASDVANKHKVPFITSIASAQEITDGRPFAARYVADANYISPIFARIVVNELKPRDVAIIVNLSKTYSTNYAQLMEKSLKANAPQIKLHRFEILGDHSDFEGLAQKIYAVKPDILYAPVYGFEGGALANALAKLNWPGKILAHSGFFFSGNFLVKEHPPIIYNLGRSPLGPKDLQVEFDMIVAQHCPKLAAATMNNAAVTYDALRALSELIETKPQLRGLDLINAYRTKTFKGLSGTRKFSKGRVVISMPFFQQIAGKSKFIAEYGND